MSAFFYGKFMKENTKQYFTDLINFRTYINNDKFTINTHAICHIDNQSVNLAVLFNIGREKPLDHSFIKFFYKPEDERYHKFAGFSIFFKDEQILVCQSDEDDSHINNPDMEILTRDLYFNLILEFNINISFDDILYIDNLISTNQNHIGIVYAVGEEEDLGYI